MCKRIVKYPGSIKICGHSNRLGKIRILIMKNCIQVYTIMMQLCKILHKTMQFKLTNNCRSDFLIFSLQKKMKCHYLKKIFAAVDSNENVYSFNEWHNIWMPNNNTIWDRNLPKFAKFECLYFIDLYVSFNGIRLYVSLIFFCSFCITNYLFFCFWVIYLIYYLNQNLYTKL